MKEYKIIKMIRLNELNKPTGFTKHFVNDLLVNNTISQLKIVNYEGDSGFYLFYCNEKGEQITDTYHDSVNLALEQAELEFNVKPSEWSSENGPGQFGVSS